MDSSNSWSPSFSSEPFSSLDSILPSAHSVLQEPTRDFCVCASPDEEGNGLCSGLSSVANCRDGNIKLSSAPIMQSLVSDSHLNMPSCPEVQLCGSSPPTLATSSHTQDDKSSLLSPSKSESCCESWLAKKPKVEAHMSQNQVRRLGEKITALQQLVSPFGKTDTASVLLEAIGYIKFLQEQVHVLSSPYMISNVNRKGCERVTDLRSRGLCLVPISCTTNVANNNGADYWISGIRGCSR